MKIKATTLGEAADLCREALLAHESGINEGFLKSGEKDFKVGLSIEIGVGAISGDFNLDVDISYTKEKIKESYSRKIRQTPLFDEQGTGEQIRCPNRPVDMSGQHELVYASYCNNKCELRCVASLSEPNEKGEKLEHGLSCAAWADRDHMDWLEAFLQDCDMWLEDYPHGLIWVEEQTRIAADARLATMETYRLQNKYNGKWWEGRAESVEKACQLAGGGTETDYNIKVKTKGGWGKPKRRAA